MQCMGRPSGCKNPALAAAALRLAWRPARGEACPRRADHFEALLGMGVKLIKEGKAYVDDTPVEKMREERMEGIESACRNQSVEQNLKMWEEMARPALPGALCAPERRSRPLPARLAAAPRAAGRCSACGWPLRRARLAAVQRVAKQGASTAVARRR